MIRLHNECQIDSLARLNLCQRITNPLVAHTPHHRHLAADRQTAGRGLKPTYLRVNHAACLSGHGSQPPPRVRDHL